MVAVAALCRGQGYALAEQGERGRMSREREPGGTNRWSFEVLIAATRTGGTDYEGRSTPMTTMVLLIAPMMLALLLVHRRDGHRARHRASRF